MLWLALNFLLLVEETTSHVSSEYPIVYDCTTSRSMQLVSQWLTLILHSLIEKNLSSVSILMSMNHSCFMQLPTLYLPILFLTCTCFQIWYEYINALPDLISFKHSSLELSKPRPDGSHYIGTKYNRYIYPGQLECKLNEWKARQSLFSSETSNQLRYRNIEIACSIMVRTSTIKGN